MASFSRERTSDSYYRLELRNASYAGTGVGGAWSEPGGSLVAGGDAAFLGLVMPLSAPPAVNAAGSPYTPG